MIRSIVSKALPVVLALVSASFAQTHTFSYGPYNNQNPTAPFTLIDGQTPSQCNCGGLVQLRFNENPYWGLEAPNGPNGGWNFPNGGFLTNNTVFPNMGQLVWDNPTCGPQIAGCTAHSDTTIPFGGYGTGVTVTVHDTYIVVAKCGRLGCRDDDADDFVYSTVSNGGTGTAVYNPPNAPIVPGYTCGSDRHHCLKP